MRLFALVVAGGAAGTLARYGIGQWLNPGHLVPLGTFAVNATGSFLLGALLAVLATGRRGRETGLLLGTGLLGGYTTYSALAAETEALLREGHLAAGLGYAMGSVVVGLVAALAGLAVGRAVRG